MTEYRDIGFCDERHDALKTILTDINKQLAAIWDKLDGRPSWGVLAIITFLSSGFFTVLALYLKGIGNG